MAEMSGLSFLPAASSKSNHSIMQRGREGWDMAVADWFPVGSSFL